MTHPWSESMSPVALPQAELSPVSFWAAPDSDEEEAIECARVGRVARDILESLELPTHRCADASPKDEKLCALIPHVSATDFSQSPPEFAPTVWAERRSREIWAVVLRVGVSGSRPTVCQKTTDSASPDSKWPKLWPVRDFALALLGSTGPRTKSPDDRQAPHACSLERTANTWWTGLGVGVPR